MAGEADKLDDETRLRVDEALTKLAAEDPRKAELVKLRYYAGLNMADAAEALGISESTTKRAWADARVWLYHELKKKPMSARTPGLHIYGRRGVQTGNAGG
jgi:RNA polymerase sigma factor (sigma-70 family)